MRLLLVAAAFLGACAHAGPPCPSASGRCAELRRLIAKAAHVPCVEDYRDHRRLREIARADPSAVVAHLDDIDFEMALHAAALLVELEQGDALSRWCRRHRDFRARRVCEYANGLSWWYRPSQFR